jgi:hypothetical protein
MSKRNKFNEFVDYYVNYILKSFIEEGGKGFKSAVHMAVTQAIYHEKNNWKTWD